MVGTRGDGGSLDKNPVIHLTFGELIIFPIIFSLLSLF